MIYALFEQPADVRRAIALLNNIGVEASNITLSSNDPKTQEVITEMEAEQHPSAGAGVGFAGGMAAGGLTGAALIAVPAVIIGAPLFILFSAAAGALYGSFAGAILGSGYELEHLKEVEESLANGKFVLAVKADYPNAQITEALDQAGGMRPSAVNDVTSGAANGFSAKPLP